MSLRDLSPTCRPRVVLGLLLSGSMVLGACGGGGDDDTSAADGVRSIDPTEEAAATDDTVTEEAAATEGAAADATEEAGAEAATDPTEEATAAAGGAPGDLDGDGEVTQAELGQYANTLLLDFSACMREQGYPDFEDMTVDLFIETAGSAGGSQAVFFQAMAERGVNLTDPEGVEALQGCGESLAQLQAIAPQPSDEETAQREADLLDFAQCMREQGLSDWPDPDFAQYPGIGYGLELTEQFDIDSPEVQTAGGACAEQGRGFLPSTDG